MKHLIEEDHAQATRFISQSTRSKILISITLICCIIRPFLVFAEDQICAGRFINPIFDICWSCLLPISIGNIKIANSRDDIKKRDTENPTSPICWCIRKNVPVPGVSIGFWEPTRLVDVTRIPYCMVNLGGTQMGANDIGKMGGYQRGYGKNHSNHAHNSFYQLHYYIYPLIYWLELITDFACLENSTFDLAYLSELDVTWNDEKLQTLINPEAFLFGNPIAQAACALDCTAASVGLPKDELFWCAGCWGNIYPFSGVNADYVGGVQSSSLLTARILAKMHRIGLALETSTNDSQVNGKLCRKSKAFKIKKSQYRLQMTSPRPSSGSIGCWPLGFSDILYSPGKEYPHDGEDWGYLIWRKKNCCML